MTDKDTVSEEETPNVASAQQDLDTIKEILFGAQVRQAEDEREQTELRMLEAIDELRLDTRKMFEQMQQSLADLNKRLDQQIAYQNRENLSLQQSIAENQQEANNDASVLQEDMQELKRELTNKDHELQDDIDCKYHQLEQLLQREIDNLKAQKADRHSLASLLTGLADQLSDADTREQN